MGSNYHVPFLDNSFLQFSLFSFSIQVWQVDTTGYYI